MAVRSLMIVALGLGLAACADPNPVDEEGEDIKITWEDQYTYGLTWDNLKPVCNSEGISVERCKCLMDMMVDEVGVDGAMYVGMVGWMHDEQAANLKTTIGDLRANRAAEIWAHEQDKMCSPETVGPGSEGVTASSSKEAVATDDD